MFYNQLERPLSLDTAAQLAKKIASDGVSQPVSVEDPILGIHGFVYVDRRGVVHLNRWDSSSESRDNPPPKLAP